MKNKQHLLTVVVAVICGYFGGMMSGGNLVAQAAKTEKAAKPPKVITAQAFHLVDEHGVKQGTWEVEHGFMIHGKSSKDAVWLGKSPFGDGLTIMSGEGRVAFLGESSVLDGTVLMVKAKSLGASINLGVLSNERASITATNATGATAVLGCTEQEAFVSVGEKDGPEAVLGSVATKDKRTGETRISSPASLTLFNKKGEVIWQAP